MNGGRGDALAERESSGLSATAVRTRSRQPRRLGARRQEAPAAIRADGREAKGIVMDSVERPPNGYALSLYDALRHDVRELRAEIARRRQEVAAHSRQITNARAMLVQAERTLRWMHEHQADEIAELEAARARVRAILHGKWTAHGRQAR